MERRSLELTFLKMVELFASLVKNAQARETYNSNLEVNRVKKCIDAKRVYSTEKAERKRLVYGEKENPEKVKS